MQISKKHKSVLLNLKDPERITNVIPTAVPFIYKGQTMVAVPHRIDETKVLRNLGFSVPSPILHYYDWPRRQGIDPFVAQLETSEFLTFNPRAFVLNDLGTGKTLSALWAFDYLCKVKRARKMLVVTPLSTLERAWADEIWFNFTHLQAVVLYGARERRLKLLKQDADIYLINHDGIKGKEMNAALIKRDDIDTVLVDEGAAFRNSSTDRWKALNALVAGRQRLWWMTGTPTPNAPTDAWAQCKIVNPDRVQKWFGQFRDRVQRKVGPYKWVDREEATDVVFDSMQPAVRFTRDQCVDLPPVMYATRHVELTKEQAAAYDSMLKKMKAEYKGGQILAVNEAVKAGKLIQICCGVAYGTADENIVIPAQNRIDVVAEIIEEAAAKVIVFVPLTGALAHIAKELAKQYTVEVIEGDTPKADRDRIFGAFQRSADPRVIVAQPAAMSHGLTLTAANTIVWFAPSTSNETYQQANGRITRPGQKHSQFIINIEGSPIERNVYARLQAKEKMQGVLLELVKKGGRE